MLVCLGYSLFAIAFCLAPEFLEINVLIPLRNHLCSCFVGTTCSLPHLPQRLLNARQRLRSRLLSGTKSRHCPREQFLHGIAAAAVAYSFRNILPGPALVT